MSTDKFKNKFRTQSARLANWDYGSNAAYFVTICTKDRIHYFGNIAVETQNIASLQPTQIGKIATDFWWDIPKHFPFVWLDEFILMPNHLHGIIIIEKELKTNWQRNTFAPQSQNLASIIRGYKAGVKKYATIEKIDFYWQPRYYDRVIRNEDELLRIRNYIRVNPLNWISDKENIENLFM